MDKVVERPIPTWSCSLAVRQLSSTPVATLQNSSILSGKYFIYLQIGEPFKLSRLPTSKCYFVFLHAKYEKLSWIQILPNCNS